MRIREYLDGLAYCGSSARLPHFDQVGFNYGFEGKTSLVNQTEVIFPKQVHGSELIDASRSSSPRTMEGDAIYTSRPQVVGVVTADCLPVLVGSRDGSFVMAIHAGWRGMAQGIILRSIVAAKRHFEPSNLLIGLGPCIGTSQFEIGSEVIDHFTRGPLDYSEAELMSVLIKGKDDRWHFDLAVAASLTLAKNGIPAENVGLIRSCTYENAVFWHSYRRDGKAAGRNLAWIRRL